MGNFEKIAKELSKVYGFELSGDISNGNYEEQVRNPAFVKMLVFNCLLMDNLYRCSAGGCEGCRANEVFKSCKDENAKRMIEDARKIMSENQTAEGNDVQA